MDQLRICTTADLGPDQRLLVANQLHQEFGHPGLTPAITASDPVSLPTTFVATIGDTIAGSATLMLDDLPMDPQPNPWLGSLSVDPHLRHSGIGSHLIRHVELAAGLQGHPELWLFCATTELVTFYSARGYDLRTVTTDQRGGPAHVMSKPL